MRKVLGRIILAMICLFCFWFFYLRNSRENRLEKEGNMLVQKIEAFRIENKRLPDSLEEIGTSEKEGSDALFYDKRDSLHYTVSFGMSIDYNKFYYSDTKTWEDGYRDMK